MKQQMTETHVSIIEESDMQRWSACLQSFPTNLFIRPEWLESFRKPKRRPMYFRFVSEGMTVGLAAGLSVEPPYRILRPLYRTLFFFSGPTGLPSRAFPCACLEKLTDYARINRYSHLHFGSWDYPYPLDFKGLSFHSITREEYIIDLRGTQSDVRKKINRMIRRKIKKAREHGLTVHESGSPEWAERLTALLEETRSVRLSKGYEAYSYFYMPYFDNDVIRSLLRNKIAKIFYVKQGDEILCAQLILAAGTRAYPLLVGSKPKGYELGAYSLILSEEIERFNAAGIESLNLGGIPGDSSVSGLTFFKNSFGAEKHLCSGGRTLHLQGHFLNFLTDIYTQLPETKLKKDLDRLIRGSGVQK